MTSVLDLVKKKPAEKRKKKKRGSLTVRVLTEREKKLGMVVTAALLQPDIEEMFDDTLRVVNYQLCAFSFLSFAVVVWALQRCYFKETALYTDRYDVCPDAFWGKCAAWLLYCGFIWRLIRFYEVECERLVRLWGYESRWDALYRSRFLYEFFVELIINGLIPFPFTGVWQMESTLWICLIFLRFYLIIRVLRDLSSVYKNRGVVRRSVKGASSEEVNTRNVAMTVFSTYPMAIIIPAFLNCIVVFAYFMYLMERQWWRPTGCPDVPSSPDYAGTTTCGDYWRAIDHDLHSPPDDWGYIQSPFRDFNVCLWWCCVTLTSVGYGDYFPVVPQGRAVAGFTVLFGLLAATLLSSVLINSLNPTKFQQTVQAWEDHSEASKRQRTWAAIVIQIAWRESRKRKQNREIGKEKTRRRIHAVLRPYLKRLHRAQGQVKDTAGSDPAADIRAMLLRSRELNKRLEVAEQLVAAVFSDEKKSAA